MRQILFYAANRAGRSYGTAILANQLPMHKDPLDEDVVEFAAAALTCFQRAHHAAQ